MGRYHREKPARLADKLLQVRKALGLTQNEMIRRLGLEDLITQSRISGYELGTREPSLVTLLRYAQVANVYVEALIDDQVDLPSRLPSPKKSKGVARASSRKQKR